MAEPGGTVSEISNIIAPEDQKVEDTNVGPIPEIIILKENLIKNTEEEAPSTEENLIEDSEGVSPPSVLEDNEVETEQNVAYKKKTKPLEKPTKMSWLMAAQIIFAMLLLAWDSYSDPAFSISLFIPRCNVRHLEEAAFGQFYIEQNGFSK